MCRDHAEIKKADFFVKHPVSQPHHPPPVNQFISTNYVIEFDRDM